MNTFLYYCHAFKYQKEPTAKDPLVFFMFVNTNGYYDQIRRLNRNKGCTSKGSMLLPFL